jgi:predicted NBD/HSP70 family sugar kinase
MEKATHQATKEHNATLALKTIYHSDPLSRADIARATGLTRTTVSDIVAELLDQGLVTEVGPGPTAVGKPPILVQFDPGCRQLICVDLGGSEFRAALVNAQGAMLRTASLPVEDRKGEDALLLVFQLVETLWTQVTAPLLGIGVGTPGPVDPDRGVIRMAVNRGWEDLDLKGRLEARFKVPIHVANDSHVAALAECAYGGHGRSPSLVLIKAGEGIGSGIILKGRLYAGEGFSAGEIGHLCVERGGLPCSCGNAGCLETVASVPALLLAAGARARSNPGSALAKTLAARGATLEVLLERFEEGDPQARSLIQDLGTHLGVAAASLAGILNIHRIVLSGAPASFGQACLDAMAAEMRARILLEQGREMEVVASTLGPDIVLQGACALVLRKELNLP